MTIKDDVNMTIPDFKKNHMMRGYTDDLIEQIAKQIEANGTRAKDINIQVFSAGDETEVKLLAAGSDLKKR